MLRDAVRARTNSLESIIAVLLLVGIAVGAPLLVKQQLIAGTIVNAAIVTAVWSFGITEGILVGVLPSTIALAAGLLPAALTPMVPFIIMGNALLAAVAGLPGKRRYWMGAVAGALVKFAFLFGSIYVVRSLLHLTVPAPVASMMSWPQLATALMGGTVAYVAVRLLKGRLNRNS
jgi:hypothetical protein